MKHYNIPVFVPHAGCPHDCVFCNQRQITGHQKAFDIEEAKQTIDTFLNSINKHGEKSLIEVAFFGGSFTGIPLQEQLAYLELTRVYVEKGLIHGVRLSTRPDYIDSSILERLKAYHVTTIELGVQSLNEEVLKRSKRGHSLAVVDEACEMIRSYGFKLGLQMMIGLPGDTLQKSIETAYKIIDLKPDMVRIYPTLVVSDTVLEDMYKEKLYQPLSLDEAVIWAARIYPLFVAKSIPVIRMGLQSSESLDYVVGPYHPSFRQLVESHLCYESVKTVMQFNASTVIYVHPQLISDVVGQKRSNLNALEDLFQIERIKVYGKEMPKDIIEVHIEGEVFKVPKMTTIWS